VHCIRAMIGRTPTRITVGPPTGMNEKHCIRAMIGRTPTRITVGPPTGMNEKQCMVMYTCYDQGNQTTKLT
jgi:methyl coenzyme M reductase subunit D